MPQRPIRSIGAIDLHFHGAFGIDVMTADPSALNELSLRLWKSGIAGFCPTTVSDRWSRLKTSVRRLGKWIRSQHSGAIPLGIHLEGPFISRSACGAHPPAALKEYRLGLLEELWDESSGTLKIITLAPELIRPSQLSQLKNWALQKRIHLSAGHSCASLKEASTALDSGFRGITHAWNAMPFRTREPGLIGAALGRKDVWLELIVDQVHVAPTVLDWTLSLHPANRICFISDCAPAAKTSGRWLPFGPLRIQFKDRASRLPSGDLAGGGLLLTEAYSYWLKSYSRRKGLSYRKALENTLQHLTTLPLLALGISERTLRNRKVEWLPQAARGAFVIPIDS